MDSTHRRSLIAALAAIATCALVGCAASAPAGGRASPAAEGEGPLVAFYGDSYTLGTGASHPSRRWSSIIAADRGWREFNPSVNGLG